MRKCFVLLFALPFALISTPSVAQTVDGYRATIYPVGNANPPTTFDYAASAALCNQTPPPAPANVVNPTKVVWDDKSNAGRVCIYTSPPGGVLQALPIGNSFEITLRETNAAGVGAESTRFPFARTLLPPAGAAPTGVRLTP